MTLSVRVTLLKFYPTIDHGLLRNQYVHNNLITHMKLIKWLSWFLTAGSSHSHTSPLRSMPNSGFHSAPKPQIKLLYYFFCLIVPGLDCQIPSEEWPRSSQLTKCPSEWILPTYILKSNNLNEINNNYWKEWVVHAKSVPIHLSLSLRLFLY